MDFIILADSIALPRCMGFKDLGRLGVSKVITNLGGNYDFCMVLRFALVWLFCYTDGNIFDFMILGDYIALPQCMIF